MRTPFPPLLIALVCVAAGLTPSAPAAPGDLDPMFGTGGMVTTGISSGSQDYLYNLALQPDGKIVVVGTSYNSSSIWEWVVARYNPNGTLDTTFAGDGILTTIIKTNGGATARGVAIQSNGMIVVVGSSGPFSDEDFAVARYTSLGALDTTFGGGTGFVTTAIGAAGDWASDVAIQTNGKIVVSGTIAFGFDDNNFAVVRYNTNGTLDTTFSTDGKVTTDIGAMDIGGGVALQPDGKIVVAGNAENATDDFAVVRYTTAGALDTTFSTDGKVTTAVSNGHDWASGVAIQADGKIVVGGSAETPVSTNRSFAVVRYNANGTLDTSFSGDGKVTTQIFNNGASIGDIAIQSDGKIVAVGYATATFAQYFAVARYTTNGVLDSSFGTGGIVTTPIADQNSVGFCGAVQTNGKILAGGYSGDDLALARYGGIIEDTDGDGLLDSWELTYWPSLATHGALDDSDFDGYNELAEQAFGLNPTQPTEGGLPQMTEEGGYLTITIARQAGVAYEVQSAGTLLPALSNSFSIFTTTELINNATTVKVRDNYLISTSPSRFMRVKVTAAP
ncbi:MAG: hypothetical protein IT577_22335 [Verrucomicrobiae bacterium]|nr:hypothetical protein [Verrucomicrobiae bacterium]